MAPLIFAGCSTVTLNNPGADEDGDMHPDDMFKFGHYKMIAATHEFSADFGSVSRRSELDATSATAIREYFKLWILPDASKPAAATSILSSTMSRLQLELSDVGDGRLQTGEDGRMRVDIVPLQAIVEEVLTKVYGGIEEYRRTLQRAQRNDPELEAEFREDYTPEELAEFSDDQLPPGFGPFMLEQDLAGSIRYMVAHEAAHVHLGHFQKLKALAPKAACTTLRDIELAADDAATDDALSILNKPGFSIARKLLPKDVFGGLRGYHIAFREIKELHTGDAGSWGCKYPSPKERLKRAASKYSAMLNLDAEIVVDASTGRVIGVAARKKIIDPSAAALTPSTMAKIEDGKLTGTECLRAAESLLSREILAFPDDEPGLSRYVGHKDSAQVASGLRRFVWTLRKCLRRSGAQKGLDTVVKGIRAETWSYKSSAKACWFTPRAQVLGGTTLTVLGNCS